MIKRDYYPIIILKVCNKDNKRYADTTTQVYLKENKKAVPSVSKFP